LKKEKRGENVYREDKTEKIKKELEISTERYFKNDMEGMKMRRNLQEGCSKWNPKTATDPTL
jgi:hypothetical protein